MSTRRGQLRIAVAVPPATFGAYPVHGDAADEGDDLLEQSSDADQLLVQHLLECAAESGVERSVNISTDKAADPVNVLGRTKREAERRTAHIAAEAPGTYMSVRFGNVLGSRSSALTAFREQVARGGPVTVTHPDVTRYFMTVSEAVQLVTQAGAIGRDGEVLNLDMGKPVRIARRRPPHDRGGRRRHRDRVHRPLRR